MEEELESGRICCVCSPIGVEIAVSTCCREDGSWLTDEALIDGRI